MFVHLVLQPPPVLFHALPSASPPRRLQPARNFATLVSIRAVAPRIRCDTLRARQRDPCCACYTHWHVRCREYVYKDGGSLAPSTKGRLLSAFLENYFTQWVDYKFSSSMEETLDKISAGSHKSGAALSSFWDKLTEDVGGMKKVTVRDVRLLPLLYLGRVCRRLCKPCAPFAIVHTEFLQIPTEVPLAVQSLLAVEKRMEDIVFPRPDDKSDRRACPKCGDATLYLRISGAAGGFVACANYLRTDDGSKCTYRRRLLPGEDDEIDAPDGGQDLGLHPETGNEIQLKEGPYGWCGLLRLLAFLIGFIALW